MKKLAFDPATSFFELTPVRIVAFTISMMAVISTFFIVKDPALELTLSLTHEGFNNFITIFKFPIGLLALLIPIGAVFVANHRSEQTKAQMKLTEYQIKAAQNNNNFTNYFKHIEEFEKHLNQYQDQEISFSEKMNDIVFLYPRGLHKKAFPNVKSGNLMVDQGFADGVVQDINELLEGASGLKDPQVTSITIHKIKDQYDVFASKYQIKTFFEIETIDSAPVIPNSTKQLVYPIGQLSRVFLNILTFDENYKPNNLLDAAANFNYKGISGNRVMHADRTLPFDIVQLIKSGMRPTELPANTPYLTQ
ncbi:hypothetical protein [Pseudomonas sp. AN3A02]|uniref:hypothetical protein n=1 Tax=Pseudomonas sp. AN3A02 TaxID=2719587 RepID=UPI001431CD9D|nr:hypothetical protein [Pseudomonas sp. AN3A02]NIL19670.1 hypothetical protein [Pseudomonas sp. AN3A02]